MFINAFGHYLPLERTPNDYFLNVNGLTDSWIYERTGIKTRAKAKENENTNSMAAEAVSASLNKLPYELSDVDLIIGATYSPYDTVGTLAHYVQKVFSIDDARVVSVSSACSSFINAIEIAEGYFATNKASKALIVASEHNSAYMNEDDEKSGHLWGDGAGAVFVSKERITNRDWHIESVQTKGLGHIGRSTDAVFLHPTNGGLLMPFGKDVFVHAIKYMTHALASITQEQGYTLDQLDYIIPHQANIRIINNIAKQINFEEDRIISNIGELGNTGCASTIIAMSENRHKFKPDNLLGFTVFGGGYSCGSMLVRSY